MASLNVHLLSAEVPVGEGVPDGGEPLLTKLLLHHPLDRQPVELQAPQQNKVNIHNKRNVRNLG